MIDYGIINHHSSSFIVVHNHNSASVVFLYHQSSSFFILKLKLSLFIINHQYSSFFSIFNYHASLSIFIEPEKMKGNSVTSFQNTSCLLHLNFLFTNKKKSPPRLTNTEGHPPNAEFSWKSSLTQIGASKSFGFRGIGMGHEISHINNGRNLCSWTWIKIRLFVGDDYIGILESQPNKSVMASWFSTKYKYSFCNCGALLFLCWLCVVEKHRVLSALKVFWLESLSAQCFLYFLGGMLVHIRFGCIKNMGGVHLSSPFS